MGNSIGVALSKEILTEFEAAMHSFHHAQLDQEKDEWVDEISNKFATVFNNYHFHMVELQRMAVSRRLIQGLSHYFIQTSIESQERCLHALKWCCLNNRGACLVVFDDQSLLDAILALVSAYNTATVADEDETVIARDTAALRLVTGLTRVLLEKRAKLVPEVLPAILNILRQDSFPPQLRAQAVNFLAVASTSSELSANSEDVELATSLLADLVRSGRTDLNYLGAALALANCGVVTHSDVLGDTEWAAVVLHFHEALSNSLLGIDYPEGSRVFYTDWLMCMGIAKLCERGKLRALFQAHGTDELLRLALEQAKAQMTPGQQSPLRQQAIAALTMLEPPLAAPGKHEDMSYDVVSSLSLSPVCEGMLSVHRWLRWQGFYAILSKSTLRLWETENQAKEQGFVDPTHRLLVTAVEHSEGSSTLQLSVIPHGGHTETEWTVKAKDSAAASEWVTGLRNACVGGQAGDLEAGTGDGSSEVRVRSTKRIPKARMMAKVPARPQDSQRDPVEDAFM